MNSQIHSNLLNHGDVSLVVNSLDNLQHFFHRLHLDKVVKGNCFILLKSHHQACLLFIGKRPDDLEGHLLNRF